MFFHTKTHDPLEILDRSQGIPQFIPEKKWVFLFSLMRNLFSYTLLTVGVFVILQFGANFPAYSQIIINYFDPTYSERTGQEITQALQSSSIQVYADPVVETAILEEKTDDLARVTEQIKAMDPKITNDTSYDPIRLSSSIDTSKKDVTFDIVPYDNRIIIPKIGKNIPLVDVRLDSGFDFDHIENIFMEELQKWVVRYPGTSLPWQTGNAFIFWHSSNYPWMKGQYNDVFALLDKLSPGDEIIVYYWQKKFTYTMKEKTVVKPGNVKALQSRDPNKKELSLMTCWPIGTNLNRLIVFAELQE